MREVVIQFQQDGDWVQEIEETRQYFLSEAEDIIQSIRKRLMKEKRDMNPKAFSLLIEGKEILHAYAIFHHTEHHTLQEQIVQTILCYEAWEEEIRQKYVNKIKEYSEAERQAFIHPEFQMFAIRVEEVLEANFSLSQMKYLFDQVYANLTTGFFSKMEEVITSLAESYQTVLTSTAKRDLSWFEEEKQFHTFGQYVLAHYLSVSKRRLAAIQVQFEGYHKLQEYLFTIKVEKVGFYPVLQLHEQLQGRFVEEWDQILFQGFSLRTEDMVTSLLLAPLIQSFFREELEKEDISTEEKEFIGQVLHMEYKEENKHDQTTSIS